MYIKHVDDILEVAYLAGEKILEIYNSAEDIDVEYKKDNSPVTYADKEAHKIIQKNLEKIFSIPVLSEEGKNIPYDVRKHWEYFWLVDPLDGTKEFIKRNGEFTVNIALIHKSRPIFGVVYAPAKDVFYFGGEELGSYKLSNGKKESLPSFLQKESVTVVITKSHMNEETKGFLEKLKKYFGSINSISIGSSLKICLVAEGKADIYPRIGPTMEWDTAAAHAVLNAANGKIVKYNGEEIKNIYNLQELNYNKENLLNPYFIAFKKDVF
jgi:3'(2'), 5'-bisphosphate nucleotidase